MCSKFYIIQPEIFQFTEPEFCLGQKVKTRNDLVGYISGLIFYPDAGGWCYWLHFPNQGDGGINEIWYVAEELNGCVIDQADVVATKPPGFARAFAEGIVAENFFVWLNSQPKEKVPFYVEMIDLAMRYYRLLNADEFKSNSHLCKGKDSPSSQDVRAMFLDLERQKIGRTEGSGDRLRWGMCETPDSEKTA